jgi:drug/metabolite transporter (DMT)-like permease
VTAILGGLGAACSWAVAMLCSARASRSIGASVALAWVMSIGLALTLPFVVLVGSAPSGGAAAWLVVAGVGNVAGLLLEYQAVRSGKVGVVAAVVSTEGAFAALIAALSGEPVTMGTGFVLASIAVGIVLASLTDDEPVVGSTGRSTMAVALALGAALCFATSLFAAGHVSGEVALVWVVLPGRAVGALVLAAPLALRRRLRIHRNAVPFVAVTALAEIAGIVSFALGARDAIGVTSVLGSQFAALAAVGAFFVFGERLRRIQIAGVAVIVAGVSALAVLRA